MQTYGAQARTYMAECQPSRFSQIDDPDAYFSQLQTELNSQASLIYRSLARPELGTTDLAARMMTDEILAEQIYPTPMTDENWDEDWDETEVEYWSEADQAEWMAQRQAQESTS